VLNPPEKGLGRGRRGEESSSPLEVEMKTAGYGKQDGQTRLTPGKDVGVLPFELDGVSCSEPMLRVCIDGDLAGKAIELNPEFTWLIRVNELGQQVLIPRKKG
jgi:hypothetical protein